MDSLLTLQDSITELFCSINNRAIKEDQTSQEIPEEEKKDDEFFQ
jgi:hypothetical protein